jgi:hypothetical protein
LAPIFSWSAVSHADSYELRVNDLTTGQTDVLRQTTSNTALASTVSFALGDQYQWWVRALSANGTTSSWGAGAGFTLVLESPAPTGPSGVVTTALPTFSWNPVPGADYYIVSVDDLTAGQPQVLTSPQVAFQLVTATNWTATAALTPGDHLQWYVRAMTFAGAAGPWSASVPFTVSLLNAPVPLTPLGLASGSTLTFQWNPVPGASYYQLWIEDVTPGSPQFASSLAFYGSSSTVTSLIPSHSYRWWVQSVGSDGITSNSSPFGDFTIAIA